MRVYLLRFIVLILCTFCGTGLSAFPLIGTICSPQVESMRESIGKLNPNNHFVFLDLDLSTDDFLLIETLKIESMSEYNRYGDLHLLNEELPHFLRSLGNDNEELILRVTEIISRIALNITEAANKETAWICVRSSLPHHYFDTPRWHFDGHYHTFYKDPEFKFVAVLKGNHTLFYNLPKNMRETFIINAENREYLNSFLDIKDSESPINGFGALFLVGEDNSAAIHSEPPIDSERLFFSVMVGEKTEIHELYLRQLE